MARISLGDRARDVVTGYTGVVVGRSEWLTGCSTYGLQTLKADGTDACTLWFDEARVEVVERGVAKLVAASSAVAVADHGGPQPAPQRGNRQ